MRTAAFFLAMVLIPGSATAQEVAHSLEQLNLQQVLGEGETLWIVVDFAGTGEYQEVKAKLSLRNRISPSFWSPASYSAQFLTRYRDFAYLYWLRFGYFIGLDPTRIDSFLGYGPSSVAGTTAMPSLRR